MKNRIAEWNEILKTLRALRLAVYDDLLTGNAINPADVKVEAALGWLIYHRLVTKTEAGYVAIAITEAGKQYREHGPAGEAAGALMAEHVPSYAKATEGAAAAEPITPHQSRPIQQSLF